MAKHRSNYLIDQLISNKLSGAELDEFFAGLHAEEELQAYSDILEMYFNALLDQPEQPPDSAEKVESLSNERKPET